MGNKNVLEKTIKKNIIKITKVSMKNLFLLWIYLVKKVKKTQKV
jgi:hypothetical protein